MNKHFLLLYVLVALLAAWIVVINAEMATYEWICIDEACAQDEPGGEQWAQQNCFVQEETTFCEVSINAETQILPLEAINLSSISVCTETVCRQEALVRTIQ
ncbi:MAG: hypothetical protein ACMXYD_03280 [Candidatus Woesearchaeota archaeon]